MHLIFLGPPGAGKGTQAKILSNELNIIHLSTGEILREMSNQNNKIGKLIKETMSKGLLVSDELITEVVEDRIKKEDCKSGFILDGYPRTILQANSFEEIIKKINIRINNVIQIDLPEEILLKRIIGRQECKNCSKIYNKYFNPFPLDGCNDCGKKDIIIRKDDDEYAFKNVRLKKYYQETQPLIDYYNGMKLLYKVDGEGSVEEISKKILKFIKKIN
tara:strand:+ start:13122 stop:13775 length:654 start_codon:yes stop_codon:yes gene_type:complete